MSTIRTSRYISQLDRQSSKREIVGSIPAKGKKFSVCNTRFLRLAQLESANANGINRGILLAYMPCLAKEWYVYIGSQTQ